METYPKSVFHKQFHLFHISFNCQLRVPGEREREVKGSIPSVGDIGVRSDMAGW